MKSTCETLWEDVLSALKPQMNDESYELWFKPVKPVTMDSGKFVLQVPNNFFLDWLRNHYQQTIEQLLKDRAGQVLAVDFQVGGASEMLFSPLPAPSSPVHHQPEAPALETHLNLRYTFDT